MAYRTAIVAHDVVTDCMIGEMKVASLVIITPRYFDAKTQNPSER
jgi:hypothetical protein